MATLGHKVSVQAHRATQVWSGRSPDGLTEADPRGRLSRKHRVCGGKPTNGSNRRRRRRHSDGECMEDRGRGGGRNLGRSLSLSISPPSLSDEIVFKWSCARNDDRRRNDDDDDDANDPEEGKFDFALWGWPSGWLPESG